MHYLSLSLYIYIYRERERHIILHYNSDASVPRYRVACSRPRGGRPGGAFIYYCYYYYYYYYYY